MSKSSTVRLSRTLANHRELFKTVFFALWTSAGLHALLSLLPSPQSFLLAVGFLFCRRLLGPSVFVNLSRSGVMRGSLALVWVWPSQLRLVRPLHGLV